MDDSTRQYQPHFFVAIHHGCNSTAAFHARQHPADTAPRAPVRQLRTLPPLHTHHRAQTSLQLVQQLARRCAQRRNTAAIDIDGQESPFCSRTNATLLTTLFAGVSSPPSLVSKTAAQDAAQGGAEQQKGNDKRRSVRLPPRPRLPCTTHNRPVNHAPHPIQDSQEAPTRNDRSGSHP